MFFRDSARMARAGADAVLANRFVGLDVLARYGASEPHSSADARMDDFELARAVAATLRRQGRL
jgi:hypothetical protein